MSDPRVVAIVQARMGSSRLPGKVLERAAGRALLDHLAERLGAAKRLSAIVVATTRRPLDDVLEAEAARLGLSCFRGSEDDVLERFVLAARAAHADVVVRITADCPLLDPAEVDRVVAAFLAAPLDYAANFAPDDRRIPLGLSVEVFSRAALERAHAEGRAGYHREHVTPYLYEEKGRFRTCVVHPAEDLSHLRLTVDTPEDLAVVRTVLEAIEGDPDRMSLARAARFLAAHPEIARLNASVRQRSFRESDGPARLDGAWAFFRADATPEVGAGHAMRCLAIAEAWVLAGGRAALLGLVPASIAERFAERGIEVHAVPTRIVPGSEADALWLREAAEARGAVVVVADGYAFEARWLATLRGPFVTAYVDDFSQQDLPVDVVLDPNAGGREEGRGVGPKLVLAGARYTPLRAEFGRDAAPARSFERAPLGLLLTFGASDPARLSLLALRVALAIAASVPLRITVLAGPMHPDLDALRALAASTGEGALRPVIVHDTKDVAALFASIDLAVAAAGSTAWELAAMGAPMLLVAVADNQRAVIDPLVTAGAARRIDLEDARNEAKLADAIEAFVRAGPDAHRAMARACLDLVDGRGASRICRALADAAFARAAQRDRKERA
ncbi:NTP transferase domain-containing protein [Polyangium sp. 15x6]|uniref:cytidylyltransferase domain-containing protein n=1 Tax=Polyangium sp. 15x6 TaxID=3042687 RepID=UPI00249C42CD|nr:NTP transferase domain-containing protein [Polyangium sp. 15x6]MDI3286254.1 NTP transferase domain-containing protein [Polyangium sp. 15x6]